MESEIGNTSWRIFKSVMNFCLPGGLIFCLAVLLNGSQYFSHVEPLSVTVLPLIILGVGLLLSWRFNRSVVIFALLGIALAAAVQRWQPGYRDFASMLLPLNLALIALIKERGIFTLRGALRILLIMLQLPLVLWLAKGFGAHSLFSLQIMPQLASANQPLLLAMGLASVVLLSRYVFVRSALLSGFFWANLAICWAALLRPEFVLFYYQVAALILLVAVVESSYSMAYRDELTSLPARRALNEEFLKLGRHYTVAMVDIDHFKKFNDRHGHDVGDQVLRMVASCLGRVGGGGRAFRYGGEEFTIIFPGKDVDEALPHLENVRKSVAAASFTIRGRKRPSSKPEQPVKSRGKSKKVNVRVSIGLAERSYHYPQPKDVVKAADKALYRAKKQGRNRVCT